METRRLITALVVGFAVYLAYTATYNWMYPAPETPLPRPEQQGTGPAAPPTSQPLGGQGVMQAAPEQTQPATTSASTAPWGGLEFVGGDRSDPITIGDERDDLKLELTPRGAAVTTLWLTERKKDGQYAYRDVPDGNEPYELLVPVVDNGRRYHSYQTHKLLILEYNNAEWRLDDLTWQLVESDARKATFSATLRHPQRDESVLRVTKTYEFQPEPKLLHLTLAIENLSAQPLSVSIFQDGPVGIRKEHLQYDMRSLTWALRDGGEIVVDNDLRGDFAKLPPDEPKRLDSPDTQAKFLWTALANKYFGVFTRPLPNGGDVADYIQKVEGMVAVADATTDPGDMLARFATTHLPIAAGAREAVTFELYAGPKDNDVLEKTNPAFVDKTLLGYQAARKADSRCACCVIPGTPELMKGFLDGIYAVVRNYGIAIMILVLIIRTMLHPLAVYQQKSMYRMQEVQVRIQPKIQALEERHANDKATLNREKMKLMTEEGANPAGMIVSMLPMLVQMPILVALWVGINTDIHLRHAPFDGWWIDDLSAPDALIEFGGNGLTIPVLSWLPLIGRMFTNISSFNLLPVLMGVSMWLQQKYMPKPAQQARAEAAKKAAQQPNPKKAKGMSPEDQLRQQRMMAYMMSIMFPLMFYYMPSGLNLYWMSTNIFGIFESLRIKKQLAADKERREREGPKPPSSKKPGLLGRAMKRLAERAEGLQQKADELSDQKKKRP